MSAPQPIRPVPACPYCGGEQFTDGDATSYGHVQFAPRLSGGRRPGGKLVHARMCNQCGNIQLYVPVSPKRG